MKVMRDLIGITLSDRYRLVARIAGGGMGEVYRAHDLLLDRSVAVKVLQPSLAVDPDLVDRFRAEARAAARLTHPNVVAVHDWGYEDDRTYYMVMEYVPGTDLRDILVSRGTLEPAHAIEIVANLCDALSVAHSVGLIHRDVKPENILLARDGTVKVADFGIAAVADSDFTAPGGAVPGTLRYLAPEQAQGNEATKGSDIWAAGAVLAELLTGMPPLQGSVSDILRRRAVEEPASPSASNPEVPQELDAVVLRACAIRPEDRYRDAADMARDLRWIEMRSPADAAPISSLLDQLTGEINLPDMEPTAYTRRSKRMKGRRRVRDVLRAALVAVALALLVGGGVKAAPYLFGPAMVDVPDLTGMRRAAAAKEAGGLGLQIDVVRRTRDPDAPAGEVISQSPQAGELEEGSTIELVISAGPPLVRLPDLTGMTRDQAQNALSRRNLELGEIEREYSLKEAGTVISQTPSEGKLEWGSTVGIVISRGPEPVEVPPVIEMKAEKAKGVIAAAGFVPVMVDAYSDDVPAGRVISTDPAAGAVTGKRSEVKVYVSIGPQYEKLKMPDVRNMTVEQAKSKLLALGLRVRVEQSCGGGDVVVETDPVAGTTVRENDLVAFFVC